MEHLSKETQMMILKNEIIRTESEIEKCQNSPIKFFNDQVIEFREKLHQLRNHLTKLTESKECQTSARFLL